MKKYYDRNAKLREFLEGSLVLIRTLELLGKLEDVWEGPYEIQRKLGDVTYELAIPGRRSGKRQVHVNMLKEWKQGVASVCRPVVADERVEDVKDVTILGKSELTSAQQEQVQEILTDFSDLTNSETGTFANTEHGIVTGDAPPSIEQNCHHIWAKVRTELELNTLHKNINSVHISSVHTIVFGAAFFVADVKWNECSA